LVPAASSAGDEAMPVATIKADRAQCIEAAIIARDRRTTSLISKRKNRAIAQGSTRSIENA
jgi:hypothetical protein